MRIFRSTSPLIILALIVVLLVQSLITPANAQNGGNITTITPDQNGETISLTAGDVLQVELPLLADSALDWRLILTETFDRADVTVFGVQNGSPAAAVGLQPGDTIRFVNGVDVRSDEELDALLLELVGETVTLDVTREGEDLTVELAVNDDIPRPTFEWVYVAEVTADSPADEAGFEPGDAILAVDGVQVGSIEQLVDHIVPRSGVQIVVTVRRGTEKLELPVTPRPDPVDNVPRIGVGVNTALNLPGGLSVGNLNVTGFFGVLPFRGQTMPENQRAILVQRGDPRFVTTNGTGEEILVWLFEAEEPGETRLTFAYGNFDLADEIAVEDVFEVLVEVEAAPLPGLSA